MLIKFIGDAVTAAKLQGWADGFETAVSEQMLARASEKLLIQKKNDT